ncbi:hypothetical protein ACIO3O_02475 [Streptomyces sp. NPDC087440]|uniref:hypothetical protein n=1 Tax=Streptomyces sp. NPDC087440 TaxID=3365790 RepID=UPI0038182726
MLARGKEIAAVDGNGEGTGTRIPKTKDWRVEGQKSLAFDATAWVRLRRDKDPQIVAARSLKFRVPREGEPMEVADFTVERLVFGLMGCTSHVQPEAAPKLTGDLAEAWLPKVDEAAKSGVDGLKKLWFEVEAEVLATRRKRSEHTDNEADHQAQASADAAA